MGKKIMGGAKNLLFGKKDTGTADRRIGLDESLRNVTENARYGQQDAAIAATGDIKRLRGQSLASRIAEERAGLSKQYNKQASADRLRARQLVAQRGLGRSSVGVNAILGADEGARMSLAESLARSRQTASNRRFQDIAARTGLLNSILGAKGAETTFVKGRKGTGRGGGLFDVALTAGGAYLGNKYGGKGGGAAGASAGKGLASSLRNV